MSYAPASAYDATNVIGRRIAAALIDFIPALVIGFVVVGHSLSRADNVSSNFCDLYRVAHSSSSVCIQPSSSSTAYYGSDFRGTALLFSLIYWFAIAGVLQGATGATFGKHMVGLRVVDANGNLCGMGKSILRTVIGYFEIGFCFLIGCITALATHPHRRIGDFAAGTYVVAKESVGRPLGSPPNAYPPAWAPPGGPVGWGPPPAGGQQGWGSQAQPPTWGAPPASSAPPAWGTPAASPPPAQTPTTWGAPPPAESQPTAAPTPAPVDPAPVDPLPMGEPVATPPHAAETPAPADAPGWGAPAESVAEAPAPQSQAQQPQPEPQAASPAAQPSPREPQWDAQRNAWVFWEAETNRWLQHDPATGTWGPLR